jgi:hypothetical protein
MKIKTQFIVFLLLVFSLTLSNCASLKPGQTPGSVEEAEAVLAKQAKKNSKEAKKAQKAAYKHYWSLQSKEARKSIIQNKKRNKRMAKARKG